jgi:hypothetical protein
LLIPLREGAWSRYTRSRYLRAHFQERVDVAALWSRDHALSTPATAGGVAGGTAERGVEACFVHVAALDLQGERLERCHLPRAAPAPRCVSLLLSLQSLQSLLSLLLLAREVPTPHATRSAVPGATRAQAAQGARGGGLGQMARRASGATLQQRSSRPRLRGPRGLDADDLSHQASPQVMLLGALVRH